LPYLFKRPFRFVLVAAQEGDDLPSFELELRQECCRHPFSVHHDPLHQRLACRLLIAVEHQGFASRQVVITTVRG